MIEMSKKKKSIDKIYAEGVFSRMDNNRTRSPNLESKKGGKLEGWPYGQEQ